MAGENENQIVEPGTNGAVGGEVAERPRTVEEPEAYINELLADDFPAETPESSAPSSTAGTETSPEPVAPSTTTPETPAAASPAAAPAPPSMEAGQQPVLPVAQQPQPQTMRQPPTQEQIYAHREQVRQGIEQRYLTSFSPQDQEALITEPAKVLAKLASQMYLDIFDGMNAMRNQDLDRLPSMMQAVAAQTQREAQIENAFFNEFPALNKPEYTAHIVKVSQMYRELYPQGTAAEIGRLVGTTVMTQLGLATSQPQNASQATRQPQQAITPHVPTGVGASQPTAQARAPLNEWEELLAHEMTF